MSLPAIDPPTMDMHVHSTFSDGKNTIEENIEEATALGLTHLTCVDHVRVDTDYLPDYVAAVQRLRETTDLTLLCAVEAKLLNTAGDLDLPPLPEGVDLIYAADHQVPWADGPRHPRDVKEQLEAGTLTSAEVFEALLASTTNAVLRHEHIVLAHLFSILPKIGLREEDVPMPLIETLADVCAAHGAQIEVSERWSCPSARTVRPFIDRGVPLLLSTDSHLRTKIARYDHCIEVVRELAAPAGA